MTTREEIIAAAKEAGFLYYDEFPQDYKCKIEALYAIAQAAEREECANCAGGYDSSAWSHDPAALHVADMVATSIAKQLRNMKRGTRRHGAKAMTFKWICATCKGSGWQYWPLTNTTAKQACQQCGGRGYMET